ncbi:hypothetical protein ACLOJK_015713 [Asimina triloba]
MHPVSRAYLSAFRPLPHSIDPRRCHSSTSSCPTILSASSCPAILSAQLTLTLQKSPQCLFLPPEGTLFVIPDIVLHQILLPMPSKTNHIHYHVSPKRLVFEDLCQLPSYNYLPTLLRRKNHGIIKTDSEERTVDINQIPSNCCVHKESKVRTAAVVAYSPRGNDDEEDVFGVVADRAGAEAREGKERADFELAGAIGVDVWIRDRDPIDVHHSFLQVRLGDAKIRPSEKGQEAVAWGKLAKVFKDEPLGEDMVADEISLGGHKEEDFVEGKGEFGRENGRARGRGGVASSWVDRARQKTRCREMGSGDWMCLPLIFG